MRANSEHARPNNIHTNTRTNTHNVFVLIGVIIVFVFAPELSPGVTFQSGSAHTQASATESNVGMPGPGKSVSSERVCNLRWLTDILLGVYISIFWN